MPPHPKNVHTALDDHMMNQNITINVLVTYYRETTQLNFNLYLARGIFKVTGVDHCTAVRFI